VETLNHFLFF